jgi:hypothetical protein
MTGVDGRPRLLVRPAPAVDGRYDDEDVDRPQPAVHGSLALAFPAPDRAAVPLRLVPPAADVLRESAVTDLPDVRAWTARLAQAVAEVLAGARPASQLSRFATLDVLSLLERWSGRYTERDGAAGRRPQVCSVHVSAPGAGIAEACSVLDMGSRRRAIALRLEAKDGRWRCTELQLG